MARPRRGLSRRASTTFHFETMGGGEAHVETRIMGAREWYRSEESHDPAWHVGAADTPGRVLAVRLTLGPL